MAVAMHRALPHGKRTIAVGLVIALAISLSASVGRAEVSVDLGPCANPGTICAWGDNSTGALGTGDHIDSYAPIPVPGLTDIVATASGTTSGDQSYAYALRSDGTLFAWGYGGRGQMMNVTNESSDVPQEVPSFHNVRAIAAGGWSGLGYAILSDGTAWAVGPGAHGQLGNGTFSETAFTPAQVSLTDIQAIAVGGYTTYGLRTDGTVWSWGLGDDGQLGDGSGGFGRHRVNLPVQVSGLSEVIAIAASYSAGYALRSDGTVWSWGSANWGALGNDSTTNYRFTPEPIIGLTDVTAIASSYGNLTAYALRADGTVWSWGQGYFGQLGNGQTGTNYYSAVPVQVENLSGVTSIGAGMSVGYAVQSDGKAFAWGANYRGQLGNGTSNSGGVGSAIPVEISNLVSPTKIAGSLTIYALIGTDNPAPEPPSISITPTHGIVGTNFTARYACLSLSSYAISRTDGQPVTGVQLGIPVTGDGKNYIQSFEISVAASYVLQIDCDGVQLRSDSIIVSEATVQTYVAMGDSYSSGEGNPPYDLSQKCHRGSSAWPSLLPTAFNNYELTNVACSAAKTNALHSSFKDERPQIEAMADHQPDLVTITIGGNDVGFSNVVRSCVLRRDCDSRVRRAINEIRQFTSDVVSIYTQIKDAAPENARILVIGYPRIFPRDHDVTTGCGWLKSNERELLNEAANVFDQGLRQAAVDTGIEYVSTLDVLEGHELCTEDSWMHPARPTGSASGHPTPAGQGAIGLAVTNYLISFPTPPSTLVTVEN